MQYLLHLEKERLREEHQQTALALKSIQKEHETREAALETL